jgi:hypothetical protein
LFAPVPVARILGRKLGPYSPRLADSFYSHRVRFRATTNPGPSPGSVLFCRNVEIVDATRQPVDGSQEALWDVVQFFNKGGERNSFIDSEMKPLDLTEAEVDDLIGFLSALTSDRFSALRARGTGPQHTTYLYSQATQHNRATRRRKPGGRR